MTRRLPLCASVVALLTVCHLYGQASLPEIPFESQLNLLKPPADIHLGGWDARSRL